MSRALSPTELPSQKAIIIIICSKKNYNSLAQKILVRHNESRHGGNLASGAEYFLITTEMNISERVMQFSIENCINKHYENEFGK